jgi:hypothetical protein
MILSRFTVFQSRYGQTITFNFFLVGLFILTGQGAGLAAQDLPDFEFDHILIFVGDSTLEQVIEDTLLTPADKLTSIDEEPIRKSGFKDS